MITVDKVVDVLSGFAFKSSLFNDTGEGLPLVRIRDVGRDTSGTFYAGAYKKEYILNNGDFIIGMDGDFRLAEWNGGAALLNQRVCKVTPKKELINPKYLYYFLPKKLKEIEDRTSFATVKHLSVKGIKAIEIPLPALAEQKKIAAILDAADNLRQKDQQLIAKYNALSQSLFLDMFGDPVTNPMGWNKVHLNELCSFQKHSVLPSDILDGMKYLALEGIEKETGKIVNYQMVQRGEIKSNKFVFDKSHILYGKLRPYLNKVATPSFSGICSTEIIPIEPLIERTNKYFITSILRSTGFVTFADKNCSGANLPRISPKKIEAYFVINPPIILQNQFAKRIQAIEAQKQQAQASLQKSEALFNSLLQRAFKGELTC